MTAREMPGTELFSAADVVIGALYLTRIASVWATVRVIGAAPLCYGATAFYVVREPAALNSLNPRAWWQLRKCEAR